MAALTALDFSILNWISAHLSCRPLDWLFVFFTRLGDAGLIWILAGILLLFSRRLRPYGFALLGALILSLLCVNLGIKPHVERLRPFQQVSGITLLIPPPTEFSFPSGHASSSFAAAVVLFGADRRLGIAALCTAALISFSRLYLYVHFPSDVLCGAVIGAACGLAALQLRRVLSARFARRAGK